MYIVLYILYYNMCILYYIFCVTPDIHIQIYCILKIKYGLPFYNRLISQLKLNNPLLTQKHANICVP